MASTANPAGPPEKPAIYLLDAMSFIFRAYHALQQQRPMSTRSGIPTAATYVFVNMINKLRRDFLPEFLGAVFDTGAPVFRDELARRLTGLRKWNAKTQQFEESGYRGYKANRTEMPADLALQIPYIRRSLDALQIPILERDGFEADDIIGTLARQAAEAGYPTFVVSNDKDMLQLVSDRIKVLNPVKNNLVLDREKVMETLGAPPEKVIDLMALRGDAIDNVPGAPGIGEKGSVELIQQFGSVEAALDRAAEVGRKSYRESLLNNREAVLLSKELVTIHRDAPVSLNLEAMRTRQPDAAACQLLFTELEFTTLLKEIVPEKEAPLEVIFQPSPEEAERFLRAARAGGFSLAIETSLESSAEQQPEVPEEAEAEAPPAPLLDWIERRGTPDSPPSLRLAVCAEEGRALVFQLGRGSEESGAAAIRGLLAEEETPKSLHDLKAALRALASLQDSGPGGPADASLLRGPIDDLMLRSYLVNPTHASHRLADVAARFGSRPLREAGERRLPEAAESIHRMAPGLRANVAALGAENVYREIDLPLVPVLLRMEDAGVRIDLQALSAMSDRLSGELREVGERIFELAGHRCNLNSPKQLGDLLFNKLGLPRPAKYGRGKSLSTAVEVLEDLAEQHEVPRLALKHRQLSKLKSTYIDTLPLLADADSRVHTTFNQVGTATGRLSSINPNLQNIPTRTELGREIRAAFVAAPGRRIVSADYSQIELRLLAHFSEDPLLVRAFSQGEDIHTLTASEVFGVAPEAMDRQTRDRAKAVNFGIVYGISPFGLAQQLGIEQSEAKSYIERYFARYSGVRAYIDRLLEQTRGDSFVRTLFGRVRPIPDLQNRNPNLRGFAERTAVNTPLQGTAADLIKIAMIRIDRRLRQEGLAAQMTLQVHDELLFDAPEEEVDRVKGMAQQEMEGVVSLSVPLVANCGVGPNWRDAK